MATSLVFAPVPHHAESNRDGAPLRRLGRKLDLHHPLSAAEQDALEAWLGRSIRRVRERHALIEQGTSPSEIHIVVDGWACRYRVGPTGRRQIVGLLLPGDVCEFNAFVMRAMDSTIEAVTDLQVACVSRSALNTLTAEHPRLSQGLWWESMVAASVTREWMVSIGQRNARQRVAHLLCELHQRLSQVGLVEDDEMPLPITQAELGSACGLTPEHTNRTLRELRDAGLINALPGTMRLLQLNQLRAVASFTTGYLSVAQA